MNRPKLLCVDDDPQVRGLYEKVLGSHGYEVVTAGGASQALQVFHSNEQQIDAVISDYEMPGMSGAELAAELKHERPDMPVIMVSGCQPVVEEARHFVDAAVLKGAPIQAILTQIEVLLASHGMSRHVGRKSGWVPLLTGFVLAFLFIPRILK
jgi:DNA-binding NtrC family response regulator